MTHIFSFSRRKLVFNIINEILDSQWMHSCSILKNECNTDILHPSIFLFKNIYDAEGLYSYSTCGLLYYCIYCVILNFSSVSCPPQDSVSYLWPESVLIIIVFLMPNQILGIKLVFSKCLLKRF